jgi:hypothetical protein
MCNGQSATYLDAVKIGAVSLKLEIFVYEIGKFGPIVGAVSYSNINEEV